MQTKLYLSENTFAPQVAADDNDVAVSPSPARLNGAKFRIFVCFPYTGAISDRIIFRRNNSHCA